MGGASHRSAEAWALARRQHWVVTREQLLALGFTPKAIEHRLRTGRLHRLWPGVYAVGRHEVGTLGRWLAAVFACGDDAALSHGSAAALWGFAVERSSSIDVSVPAKRSVHPRGIRVHRRAALAPVVHRCIPVTDPIDTLIDLAATDGRRRVERAINEANALGLIDPDELRKDLDGRIPRPGVGALRRVLGRHEFRFTRSGIERQFLALALEAGLPLPQTNVFVHGFEVDFYWPALGLIVETDSLTHVLVETAARLAAT